MPREAIAELPVLKNVTRSIEMMDRNGGSVSEHAGIFVRQALEQARLFIETQQIMKRAVNGPAYNPPTKTHDKPFEV